MANDRVLILVAEDHPSFQEFVCGELRQRKDFDIVAVADGSEAVQRAQELQPDLALLDIGLPGLNGLAAAREIQSRSPKCRVAFLTQESSADVVLEAIRLGARGYIDKTRARYVLPVAEAIVDFPPAVESPDAGGHQVHFYVNDDALLDCMERFLGTALAAGNAAVAIATEPHKILLVERLRGWDADIDGAIEQRRLTLIDVTDVTSLAISEGVPAAAEFLSRSFQPVLDFANASGKRVAAFGECSDALLAAGHHEAAIGMERVANELVQSLPMDIMCACRLPPLERVADFKAFCAQHMAVAVR